MEIPSREELLSILGLGSDPKHSLSWYKSAYPDLRKAIQESISKELVVEGIFPVEAKNLNRRERCLKFPWVILKRGTSDIRVVTHDTDHALISEEKRLSNIGHAIEYFLQKSYCAGGALINFLDDEKR